MKRWIIFLIVVSWVSGILAGCIGLEKEYVEKRFFVLDASRPGEPAPVEDQRVLRFRKLSASPHCQGKGFTSRTGGLTYTSDFYNEFFLAPDILLTEAVREWLEASGLFAHVIESASLLRADLALEGSVVALYGDFRDEAAPQAVMAFRFLLIQEERSRPTLLFKKEYHRTIPLESASASALARGWNRALTEILTEFEEDLRRID
jgi:ABC-type uncharacterized transport system auxiliary subunit